MKAYLATDHVRAVVLGSTPAPAAGPPEAATA